MTYRVIGEAMRSRAKQLLNNLYGRVKMNSDIVRAGALVNGRAGALVNGRLNSDDLGGFGSSEDRWLVMKVNRKHQTNPTAFECQVMRLGLMDDGTPLLDWWWVEEKAVLGWVTVGEGGAHRSPYYKKRGDTPDLPPSVLARIEEGDFGCRKEAVTKLMAEVLAEARKR